ncbi:uncharacterized protein LOC126376970 [Pectinophora gossypiella]|uniref:uncharacterized protein LOC126376970 n=1 Tax=Pectinophora gossypiella TaxID=13191 RepID=UPI00214ECFD2|nr:uncharacterized protein LOC126376970 [Pectinophora gossypiella]
MQHIRERTVSISPQTPEILEIVKDSTSRVDTVSEDHLETKIHLEYFCCCDCHKEEALKDVIDGNTPRFIDPKIFEIRLTQKEEELREQFKITLQKEIAYLRERFNFILQNEQVRTSYMLREAHRERKEKVAALQTQLECKNMAGLMYVMCSERMKSKMEKLQIIEKYTNYINMLNDILVEGQNLILDLSRGYKTAARIDYEWREKMKKVVGEFQGFVCHFTKSTPEQTQYFFDLPNLLKTEAAVEDDPNEDPIEEESSMQLTTPESDINKSWWERLEDTSRPFVVYGDMADFKPPQRRETLKRIKAAKTAPKKWKEYTFHDMFIHSDCPNMDAIKDDYFDKLPDPSKWDCMSDTFNQSTRGESKAPSRRGTATSVDMRGNMGSILKIITASGLNHQPVTKANLLGARDSMEIASTTKLREKRHSVVENENKNKVLKGFKSAVCEDSDENTSDSDDRKGQAAQSTTKQEENEPSVPILHKNHTDSLTVVNKHVPERDHKINYEKICPMEECKRMHVDEFMKSLPSYMHQNPYTYVEQSYENYEACTPEQLEILKQRIAEKNKRDKDRAVPEREESATTEWADSVQGVAVQTSDLSYLNTDLPPCTCRDSIPSSESGPGQTYNLEDLIPVKQNLDRITKECLFDSQVQFDRFKVVGQESSASIKPDSPNFTSSRLQEIRKILKKHPSLCEIFQANTRC